MKTLFAWYKGTAEQFNKLEDLAPIIMSQAARMRNNYRTINKNV